MLDVDLDAGVPEEALLLGDIGADEGEVRLGLEPSHECHFLKHQRRACHGCALTAAATAGNQDGESEGKKGQMPEARSPSEMARHQFPPITVTPVLIRARREVSSRVRLRPDKG